MMIRTLASTLALVLALGLGGAANAQTNASDPIDTDSGFELGIAQQNNSGEIGTVTLYKSHSGARTLVVISMHGTPAGIAQPAHIHRGTCDNLNPVPTWPLHNVVNGQSRTWLDVPREKILSGNYSVNVHRSTTNLKLYVACGHLFKS